MKLTALPAFILTGLISHALAGPLKEAKINQIVNDVKVVEPRVGAHPAALQELIKDDLGVATGVQSRAELLFQDSTLTRLGAETLFTFKPGTRDLNLDRGSILLQVPKNLGGAHIRAASVTASITGTTIMIEHLPGSSVKIAVLEGSLEVGVDRKPGQSITLRAGKMVILGPQAKDLPKPVDVNLRTLVLTSPLIDPGLFKGKSKAQLAVLPSMGLIEKEIALQNARTPAGSMAMAAFDAPMVAGEVVEMPTPDASPAAVRLAETGVPVPESDPTPTGTDPGLATRGTTPTIAIISTDRSHEMDGKNEGDNAITGGVILTTASGTPAGNSADISGQTAGTTGLDSALAGQNATLTGQASGMNGLASGITGNASGTGSTGPTASVIGQSPANTGSTGSMTGSTSLSTGSTSVTTVTPPALPGPTPPPAIIAIPNSYVIDNTTTIDTANHTIVTGGVGNTGGQFQSVAVSGSPSSYLFGTPSAFDTATGIDANFSVMAGGSAPGAGVTVYRFADLDVQDDPTVSTTGGAKDIAFVAQNGITSNSSGSAWNVDSLRSLFFGSINGPIVIAKEFRKNSLFSGFQYLRLYARGTTGLVTLDGKISLALASLYVDAQQGINVSNNAKITTLNTVFNTPGTIVFDASPTSATLKLNAGTGIRLNALLGNASVEMTAPLLQTTANLSALTGFLNIGAGGIQAAGNTLSGFDHINVAGNVTAGSISVWNGLNIGGTFKAGAPSGAATLSAGTMAIGGGVDLTAAASRNGGTLTVNARDVNVASTGINGIKADGADGLLALVGGGNGGTVNIGTSIRPVTNSITVDVPISASTGLNGLGALTGGDGGVVNLVARGTVAVNATVMVSDSAAPRSSRTGGKITIDSRKTSGTAIAVNNSGQLLALLNAASPGTGGAVTFVSSGGDIAVTGGTVRADKGTVDIRNNGAGNIALTNATIRGDVVKVGALGANGQLLIGGGTISADTSLKLYGGTSNGQVRFTDNVTLGGSGTKAIAGKTVTIDNGKTVTIGGAAAAKVYTGKPNYTGSGGNNSTSGTFGGVGATTQTFNKRPIF